MRSLDLPPVHALVDGMDLQWGDASIPMTPAYWAAQTWMWRLDAPDHYRLGHTLAEELLACMLGGHGIPAEVGLAAYQRLRRAMHASADRLCDRGAVLTMLTEPLEVGGRPIRYRFAAQKAAYVAEAFSRLPELDHDADDITLRNELTRLRGVGPKTASWVLRNLRGSDAVAILDVHIIRAGLALGIFTEADRVERHYDRMEASYLAFAKAIRAPASILDSVIWMTMRQLPSTPPARRGARPSGVPRQHALPL